MCSDNNTEFIAKFLHKWLQKVGVQTQYIQPGSLRKMGIGKALTGNCVTLSLMGIFYDFTGGKDTH